MSEELEQENANGQELTGLTKDSESDSSNTDNTQDNSQKNGTASEPKDLNSNPVEIVPESYDYKDVKLPDGMELDKELTDEFSSFAKESGLSQAKANNFMGLGVKLAGKIQQRFESAVKEAKENQIKTYETLLNTDAEIGGANLKQALLDANETYKAFVSDEAAQLLADTGLNKHPAIVKVFRDIGKQLKSDSIRTGGGVKHERTAEDWYPSMKKDKE